MPTVAFFLATTSHPIDAKHALWNRPLPTRRQGTTDGYPDRPAKDTLSYGRYFSAIARFCSESGWRRVLLAAENKLEQPLTVSDIEGVSIFLEKHGAFYHPARIEVTAAQQRICLVVNVAGSQIGKAALLQETRALTHLNETRPFGWLPEVFAIQESAPPMFMGEWFDGYHEFHLTQPNKNKELSIVVWDGAAEPRLLSVHQMAALYTYMAMILTACYDPVTSHQIFPWHHAAGDFVVRLQGDQASVKLIAARGYPPLLGAAEAPANESELMETLLLFFLHLSVRIRLDRLDGVSEVVWAPDSCLVPTIKGFFQGLDLTARLCGLPEPFPLLFHRYARAWQSEALQQTAAQLVESVFDHSSEEYRVIQRHLKAHIKAVYERLATDPCD